jgi:hypothetical protein
MPDVELGILSLNKLRIAPYSEGIFVFPLIIASQVNTDFRAFKPYRCISDTKCVLVSKGGEHQD